MPIATHYYDNSYHIFTISGQSVQDEVFITMILTISFSLAFIMA